MEPKKHSPKFLRQRRFFTVLPLLVLPFITFLFWALGGGRIEQTGAQQSQRGFNMQLPGAHLKDDKPLDKLSYYEQAAADSLKLAQQIKNDPYYQAQTDTDAITHRFLDTTLFDKYGGATPVNTGINYTDPNEAKVYRKLAQLNSALNKSSAPAADNYETSTVNTTNSTAVSSPDVDRLEAMMQTMNSTRGEDPEVQQLNGMLENILDIQHPEWAQEKLRQASAASRGQVFPVAVSSRTTPVSLLDNSINSSAALDTSLAPIAQPNGFYSLDDDVTGSEDQNSIEAVVHQTQTLVAGSTVKLRLLNDVYINGVLIPKDNFLFGIAELNGERLGIKISSIRYRSSLFPVALSVYDMDGLEGIYIPGAIARDVAKQSADRSVQQLSLSTLDPSIGAQAASAGIEAAKTLFSRKVKLIKVTVKAGYRVLLHDDKQKQAGN